MSDDITPSATTRMAGSLREVQAIFDDQARFDEALDRLRMRGFDRADLSLPASVPVPGHATPEQGAANPDSEIDRQQARTLAGSGAGITAAMVGAAVTVATGGAAALAAGVAIGAGALVGGATHAATFGGTDAERQSRDERADRRTLVLAVTVRDDERLAVAEAVMREAGALRVEAVTREGATLPPG